MCVQQIIWCACGHGEFLPVQPCPESAAIGNCWVVLYGDHRVVVDMACSYCQRGLQHVKPLGSAKPTTGGVIDGLVHRSGDGSTGSNVYNSDGSDTEARRVRDGFTDGHVGGGRADAGWDINAFSLEFGGIHDSAHGLNQGRCGEPFPAS
ncbi:hypothetical protein K431DRAFT_218851 [Polychaeton citri CBS 116435]|uniref:Uncharacterized protein n=1 Tax=Polychaeton citri CBS 116435 TaxID=1314669 RepID=A0A9P4QF60_9PEZI|nr:hypothetical protein K431DRAFT_218851 [Polychaeton citri CBS 116435]